jgi:hypothetical protein
MTGPNQTGRLEVQPDVAAFVAAVRARLADLTDEEREELLGGLEADLSERLAEGEADLGDPAAYAAELRAAAGLDVRTGRGLRGRLAPVSRTPLHLEVVGLLDAGRRRVDKEVGSRPWATEAWRLVVAVRPAWWVLRAWLAVELLDRVVGPAEYLTVMPSLGNQVVGGVLLLAAVVGSVLVGTGRLWPGSHEGTDPVRRLALLLLNLVGVVVVLPVVLDGFPGAYDSHALANGEIYANASSGYGGSGLRVDGHFVRNVFAYDAEGNPLPGVQLYDQKGRPLEVSQDPYLGSYRSSGARVHTYPWFNGDQKLFNVFPLPVREQRGDQPVRDAWVTTRPPALPRPPLAVVPPAVLPTPPAPEPQVTPSPSASVSPTGPASPSRRPSTRPSGRPSARPSPSTDSEKPRSR